MGIREYFERLLHDTPDNANAIEYEHNWWTWGKLRFCTNMLEKSLAEAGIKSPARIGLILENRPEHVATLLKLLATSRTTVMLNALQPVTRLIEDIQRLDIKILIGSTTLFANENLLNVIIKNTLIFKLNHLGEPNLIGGKADVNTIGNLDIAVEIPTSGTTGTPKHITLSYEQLDKALTGSGQIPKDNQLLTESVSLIAMPIVHISGLWGTLSALYTGRKMVLMPKFILEPWIEALERHKIRATFLVPTALHDLLNSNIAPERINSLKIITSGSTYCPPVLIEQLFIRYGIRVLMTYGATEFAGAIAGWNYELHEKWWHLKSGSAGKAYPDIKLCITNEFGTELPAGQTGHLEVHTGLYMSGDENKWTRTNDLAHIDSDGFLWISGRIDNIIIRGGFKIQPEKIQHLLETHSSVKEAAVIAIPDSRLNSVPAAAIEIYPKQPIPTVAELVELCRRELLPYEVPKHLFIVDALPRTPSSKINRTELLSLIFNSLSPLSDSKEIFNHEFITKNSNTID
ncbi:class I adenylate-forming enzyme family protein [Xenorhabdus bovienii]|uniref:class I adenylate-forming enzyme family protein n=1 Tax=Xenorhabdus bovienii TaxID=40576 RepID=UPI003DA4FC07